MKQKAFKSLSIPALLTCIIVLFLACVSFQLICYSSSVEYNIWYDNGILLLNSLALFVLISHVPTSWFIRTPTPQSVIETAAAHSQYTSLGKISYCLSYYSFAIYLVHYPIRMQLIPLFKQLSISMPLQVISLSCTVLTLSLALCWLLSKIPWAGKNYCT